MQAVIIKSQQDMLIRDATLYARRGVREIKTQASCSPGGCASVEKKKMPTMSI